MARHAGSSRAIVSACYTGGLKKMGVGLEPQPLLATILLQDVVMKFFGVAFWRFALPNIKAAQPRDLSEVTHDGPYRHDMAERVLRAPGFVRS
jgi:hypothetical protein